MNEYEPPPVDVGETLEFNLKYQRSFDLRGLYNVLLLLL